MKRIIFTLLYSSGQFVLSRNFRIQNIGDIDWLLKNYNLGEVTKGIDEIFVLFKPLAIAKLSKVPLTLATISGATLVSFHSSTGGSNSISPIQLNTKNGFKFSVFVA